MAEKGGNKKGKVEQKTLNGIIIKPVKPGHVIQESETVMRPRPWPAPPMDLLEPKPTNERPNRPQADPMTGLKPNNEPKNPPKKG